MTADASFAAVVAERLAELRTRWVPMTADEARAAMEARGVEGDPMSPAAVSARLAELRALADLACHLHRARRTAA
ncbi:MAG: hypothetical protein HY908_25475 [Myxococcales bacterium]|nr:hypothetical protein [Myxococcales bacterium]